MEFGALGGLWHGPLPLKLESLDLLMVARMFLAPIPYQEIRKNVPKEPFEGRFSGAQEELFQEPLLKPPESMATQPRPEETEGTRPLQQTVWGVGLREKGPWFRV